MPGGRRAGGRGNVGRRGRLRGGLGDFGEQATGLRARQRHRRDALMGRFHEPGPDFHRQAAAGGLPGRRIVVIAEADAGDDIGGVADEPGVAKILAGAGETSKVPSAIEALASSFGSYRPGYVDDIAGQGKSTHYVSRHRCALRLPKVT